MPPACNFTGLAELVSAGFDVRLKNTFLDFRDVNSEFGGSSRLRSKSMDAPVTQPMLVPYEEANAGSMTAPAHGTQEASWPIQMEMEALAPTQMVQTMEAPGGKARSKTKNLRARPRAAPAGPPTTLMLRGIPCRFSPEEVMGFINTLGLEGKYDFFYLPQDARCKSNLGYAFINFIAPGYATICQDGLQGRVLGSSRSSKVCTISPAHIQGLVSLERHFHRKAQGLSCHAPIFLQDGVVVSPPPKNLNALAAQNAGLCSESTASGSVSESGSTIESY
jgi:hypothetical protein